MPTLNCLVTGGAGFIGSHLVDQLLAQGHKVLVLDNFATGRRENLAAHDEDEALQIHDVDIRDFEAIKPLFADVDWVFHLAALADIVPSIERPLDYFSTNVTGSAHVMEAARWAGVERLVYAASSSCYGIPDRYPTSEQAEIRPQYPYALSKYLGEETALHWGQVYDIPVVSVRFFNVYGPRARTTGTYGAVFGVFLAQKWAGKPLTVVGDGTQRRDFTYVTDVANACVAAAASSQSQCIFNVGSGQTQSINHLVSLLDHDVVYIPKRPGEPDQTFADITKIQADLGWQATVSFEDGVAKMLAESKTWQHAPVWTADQIGKETAGWFKYLGKETA